MISLIAGILRLDGERADADVVARMLSQMCSDGLPHSRTVEVSGPFAAGVLHINPKGSTTPKHPVLHRSTACILSADLRLYEGPDSPLEFVANCIHSDGPDAGKHLHGDFAIASWDGARLILTRDQFGVRPLQYTIREGAYAAFASMPSALIQTGLAERVLDAETLKTYPITGMAVEPRTFFRDLKSVPAAQSVVIERTGARSTQRYWRLPLGRLFSATENPDD